VGKIHFLQQRQVIARIRVETRAFQIFAFLIQPLHQPRDLAFAVGQYPFVLAALDAVGDLQIDGQHLLHANAFGDGFHQMHA